MLTTHPPAPTIRTRLRTHTGYPHGSRTAMPDRERFPRIGGTVEQIEQFRAADYLAPSINLRFGWRGFADE